MAADDVAACRGEIIAVVGTEAPVGGHEAAARLVKRTGLAVEKPDKEWPLWDCRRCLGEARLHEGQCLGESIA